MSSKERRQLNEKLFGDLYKLYCPNEDRRFTCFYCGDSAPTLDHVPSLNCVHDLRLEYEIENYLKVPSCIQCNSFASDEPHLDIFERRMFIKEKIKKKYHKILSLPDWDDNEIEQMEFTFKKSLKAQMDYKYFIVYRLLYGETTTFYLNQIGYNNFDPRKICKYVDPDDWHRIESFSDGGINSSDLS